MHKLDVAFCDTNETYGERFAAYLMEHKAKEFTVHLFPEPELFLQKIKNEKFDLVLLGSGFSEFGEQAVLPETPLRTRFTPWPISFRLSTHSTSITCVIYDRTTFRTL